MRIVIIGSGNVACVFGRLITKAGHQVVQVLSRNIAHAASLAKELDSSFSDDYRLLNQAADLYIAAISDVALEDLHKHCFLGDKLVVHTAGAVSKEVLKMVSVNYGVLYPLQSLRKEKTELQQDVPLLIDGSSPEVLSIIEKFAFTLSSVVVSQNDEQRLKLHVAAVIVSNFSNHLFHLANEYCCKESLDFKMLQPLIEETALRLRDHQPAEMQTGPAIRKDIATLDKHLRILSTYPALKKIYLRMTDSIMNP